MILLAAGLSPDLPGQEPAAVIEAYRNEPLGNNLYRKRGIMDGNQVRTMYFNQGEIGKWPDQPSGEWPKGSGHSYLDGVAVLVGAEVAVNINGLDTVVTPIEAAYREHVDIDPITGDPWGWEPVPGYVRDNSTIPAISNDARSWPNIWPDALFTFLEQPANLWINQAEVNGEEGVDDDRDGDVDNFTYWHGYFGRGVKNADVETFFVMDDAADKEWFRQPYNYHPIATHTDRGGLGLRVEVRGMQWSQVQAEDNIFWLYDIVNISDTTYTKTVFGFLTDVGVGGTNDSGDDNASFDVLLDLAYAFDNNGIGAGDFGSWSPTGYLGYAYLESPGNPFNNFDDDQDGMVDERRDDGIDNDGDWQAYTDLDGNGEWNIGEPLNDDLGEDGVGPFDRQYNGPDEGEADGLPTPGEPDFDRTDIDESDQIGLTSMSIYRLVDGGGGDGWPRHDEGLWRRMSNFMSFDTSLQSANIHMLFASGPFELRQNVRERFSMALLYGSDLEDLIRNKVTVQNIYNANYNFARPPLPPEVTTVPGDGKVSLAWDNIAEESRDPFILDSLGNPSKDFEGYMVWRSSDENFNDIKTITDSRGEPKLWESLARYDLDNGIRGNSPVYIDDALFYLGDDSGLRHSYVDNEVTNGVTYYYAVVSYDRGDPDYGQDEGLAPAFKKPTIRLDLASGDVSFVDINAAVVVPNAPPAGYVPPTIEGDLSLVEGLGTGEIGVDILDPVELETNRDFEVIFHSSGDVPNYVTTSYDVVYRSGAESDTVFGLDATRIGAENPSQPVKGLIFTLENDTLIQPRQDLSGWLIGNSNLNIQVTPHSVSPQLYVPWPADYRVEFYDTIVDSSFSNNIPVNFKVINQTENRPSEFFLYDNDASGDWSIGDIITFIEFVGTRARFTYDLNIFEPLNPNETPVFPQGGDEFVVKSDKPFFEGDRITFSTVSPRTDNERAKDEMAEIKVVPNPYIMGASWEPATVFGAGRGTRKIDFIHLPEKCTIRIFTISGRLVKTIDHTEDGTHSWDLITEDGVEVAYGVYVFHVDAPGIGTRIGKFAIVK